MVSSERSKNRSNETTNYYLLAYNILIIVIDYVIVHLKFIYYTIEHVVFLIFPNEVEVRGEIVLITGAGHGIGKETALKYGKLGAKVVCLDINEKLNKETVKQIKDGNGKAFHYKCDVTNREEIQQVAETIKREVGLITILINNAGIMPCHSLLQHTEVEIRNMLELNVIAHFWLIQTFLPNMIENNHGHIVALSSCAGLFGLRNLVPYCSSKFAVRGLMSALQEELRSDSRNLNIKFTTIYPYMVDTGLCKKPKIRFPGIMRMVKPEEAADAIVKAQRRGIEELSIPRHFLYLEHFKGMFPRKAVNVLFDFLEAYVESDL